VVLKVHIRLFVKPNRSAMETWLEGRFGGSRRRDFRVYVKSNGDTRVFLNRSSERAMTLMSFNGRYAKTVPSSFDRVLGEFCDEFGFLFIVGGRSGWLCSKQ